MAVFPFVPQRAGIPAVPSLPPGGMLGGDTGIGGGVIPRPADASPFLFIAIGMGTDSRVVPRRAGIPPVPSLPAREPARAMSRRAFPASAAALALRRGS